MSEAIEKFEIRVPDEILEQTVREFSETVEALAKAYATP